MSKRFIKIIIRLSYSDEIWIFTIGISKVYGVGHTRTHFPHSNSDDFSKNIRTEEVLVCDRNRDRLIVCRESAMMYMKMYY